MSENGIPAVLRAIRELERQLCEPVAQNHILFRCLDPNPGERKAAIVELMALGARCLLRDDGENQLIRLLKRLKRARKTVDTGIPAKGYEQIVRATGDLRQGSLPLPPQETATGKLVVLLRIRTFIENCKRLPKVGEIQQLGDWPRDETVRTVFQELHHISGVFFPSGREELGWRFREK